MANLFSRIIIESSIGKLVFQYTEHTGTTNSLRLTHLNTPSVEGSACTCISTFGDVTNAITDAFTIKGKSGTNYTCRKSGQNIQIQLGSIGWQTLFSYSYTSSYKGITAPYFVKWDYNGEIRYGFSIFNLDLLTNSIFRSITNSQVTSTSAGYYVADTKETLDRSVQFSGQSQSSNPTGYAVLKDIIDGAKPFDPIPDPYDEAGESEPGGGEGDFDDTSDDIDIPPLPTLGATNTGFITLFNPTLAQLQSLANYMWANPLFDLSQWRKIFADPMQAILGLSIVPVAVPNGGLLDVTVGNISTGISMNVAGAQYVAVDCGTLNVNEYWGAYLDYDPYTKAEIYLPYCGIHPLAVDDIMGKAVHVVYHIDILSGACCAYVKCGGSVLYSFVGQCASSIPITGDNYTNVINGVMSIAGSVGSMIATGGMSAPTAISNIASTAVNSLKPSVERSGSMSGTGGLMAIQKPYIVLTRPRQALPTNQNKFMGYPSFINANLGDLEGYTEIESVHLENIPATGAELSELETILKAGVIF